MKQTYNTTDAAGDTIVSALKEGLAHEVEDIVKLEVTAEQMLQEEAHRVYDYLASDAKHFWSDIKGGLLDWEAATGEVLLSAADPTSLEWQLGQWWGEPYLYYPLKSL